MPPSPRLRASQLLAYALPGTGVSFMENLIHFYLLKFAADVLLVSPAATGLLLGVARVWDALSDPLAGFASDRTRTRFGRRLPWIAAAAPLLGLGFTAIWFPPESLAGSALTLWIGGALLLFVSAETAFQIPHLALGAELTDDASSRNRVFAVRLALSLAGTLLAAAALGRLEASAAPRRDAAVLAACAAIATLLLCLWAFARLREPAARELRAIGSPWRAFGDVLRNLRARRLLAVVFLEAIGFATMTTSMAFATQYLFRLEGLTAWLLAGALLAMLASVPLWLALARRFDRLQLWLASLALRSLVFGSLWLVPAGAWQVVAANVVVIGALFGCGAIFGPAVKADVIDDETRQSGERKHGTFFASWNLAQKSAEGAAVALAGVVLELSRFEPNAVQVSEALLGLRVLFAGLPCLFYAAAAALLARWPRSSRTCVSASQESPFSAAKVPNAMP